MLRNLGMFKSWIIVAVFVVVSGILLGAANYLLHDVKEAQEELVIPMGTHLVYQDENTRIYEILPKEDGGNTYILTKKFDHGEWIPFSITTK